MEGWEAGQIIAERYRLEEPIGAGGMGMVWRAEHIKLRSPVAIKVMPQRVVGDEVRSARFIREAQAAAAIRSTNVVQVLDYGVDDGIAYIAMEYLEGESLADRLDRVVRLTPRETLTVITQVAKAIARAHKKGIIHRDLKPANIFLAHEDEGEVVKVLDFGIAKLTDKKAGTDQTTQTGYLLGTPNYMSPEQTRGHKVVDQRADIWSLGIVAFECLCGERPVDGETVGDIIYRICSEDMPKPSRIAPVPIGFDRWFRKATQRDPEKRFQTAKQMALALADAMGDDVPFSDPESLDSFDRASIELSDTLAAKRGSQKAPASGDDAHVRDQPTIASGERQEIDSWDTGPDERAPTTQISGAPPDTGDGVAPDLRVDTVSEPPDLARSLGGSLRGAEAMARTTESLAPGSQRRWLLGVGAAVAVAAVVFVVFGGSSPQADVPRPATAPGTAVSASHPAAASETAAVSDTAAVPEKTVDPPAPSASATAVASSAAPRPPTPRRPLPQPPAEQPNPAPSVKPPAPGSGKIDFGI